MKPSLYSPDLEVGTTPGVKSLTVSIVSHGQARLVDTLLRQLAGQTASGLIGRVIVTLNIPEAVPEDWYRLGKFRLEIIRNAVPAGFSANHNRALASCLAGTVAILNPDLQLQGDPLSWLTRAAGEPGVGLAAPVVQEPDGRQADSARDLLTPSSVLARALGHRASSPTPAWYAGMCLVLPLAAWRAMNGFDERFRLYCEDFDLCARLRLAGFTLVQVREACVIHAAHRSSHRALQPLIWHLRSLARVWLSPAYRRYRRLLAREAASAGAQAPGSRT